MSIVSRTSRHTVRVLEQTEAAGDELGSAHTWAAASPAEELSCTVVPLGGRDADLLRQRGAVMPHRVYFHQDPGIDERNHLVWIGSIGNNTELRVMGTPRNAHGQDRLWIVDADALSHDQPTKEIV